jgi:hypothetical protein
VFPHTSSTEVIASCPRVVSRGIQAFRETETQNMKHDIRALACGTALLAAVAVVACGGKQTMASKSAAAFDEARKKGVPIASSEHGGHSVEAGAEPSADTVTIVSEHAGMPGMDHGQMSGTDQSAMAGVDHPKMPGIEHGTSGATTHDTAVMDHSRMPGMHGSTTAAASHDMAGMDHSAMGGMDHSQMPGMQHGSPAAAPLVIAPPTSNAAIAQTQPAATLQADAFDAPAPTAIEEAAKGASGMSHPMEATPKPPAPPQHEHNTPQPQPPADHHHHSGGEVS